MRGAFRVSILFLTCAAWGAMDDLARIQQTMTEQLSQLPNYTCAESIERYGASGNKKLKLLDTVRLSVAVVHRSELYALLGGEFQDKSITALVQTGFISDGNFLTMPRTVFSAADTQTWFAGEENFNGRKAIRYRFHIDANRAGWRVSAGGAFARVGVTGSFVADAATLDVLRLDYAAEGMPQWLGNKALEQSIEYERVPLGGRPVLLPKVTEMRAESFSGEKHFNHAVFSDCHEYGAQTTIRFEGMEDLIPPNVDLSLKLESGIDSATAKAGDPIRATLTTPVSFAGGSLAAGAVATGAIIAVQRHPGDDARCDLRVQWSRVEDAGGSWNVEGRLSAVDDFPDLRHSLLASLYGGDGAGSVITVNGVKGLIPAGVRMTWRTSGKR
jgi:hypothetical protein